MKNDEDVYVQEIRSIKVLGDLESYFESFPKNWIFRGQSNVDWALTPSIQRCMQYADWDSYEESFVALLDSDNSIKKAFPGFLRSSSLKKLAYIQHYGGATRLLDFSYDWRVACFFAFNLDRGNWGTGASDDCAVWAFDGDFIRRRANHLVYRGAPCIHRNEDVVFQRIIKSSNLSAFVYPFDLGKRKSLRMKRQKGLLLVQGDPSLSFGNNIFNVSDGQSLSKKDYRRFESIGKKVCIPGGLKKELRRYLCQKGFSREKLLPGQESFLRMKRIIGNVEVEAKRRIQKHFKKLKR